MSSSVDEDQDQANQEGEARRDHNARFKAYVRYVLAEHEQVTDGTRVVTDCLTRILRVLNTRLPEKPF